MRSTVLAPTVFRAWLLALVLVAAQAAGLAHRIVHAGNAPATAGTVAVAQASNLWSAGHDQGSADCRLLDQLVHGDLLCAAPLAPLPVLPPAQTAVATWAAPLLASSATVYQARGPPALQQA